MVTLVPFARTSALVNCARLAPTRCSTPSTSLVAASRSREASDRAREAELESLLSASGAALDTDEQLATLLALEARRLAAGEGTAADQALLSALTVDARRIARIPLRSGVVRTMDVSGDGATLVASSGTSVEVIDLGSGSWSLIVNTGLIGAVVIHLTTERIWGKYFDKR